jgi:putative transposase
MAPGLLLHSDRGSQYASDEYQALLKQHHVVCSMSRIVGFYNPVRLHSTLGYLSPAAYEAKSTVKNLSACPK